MKHRSLSNLFALMLLVISSNLLASPLPQLKNLQQDKELAGERFLLVLVSQPDCTYCTLIEEEILNPMQVSGNYDNQLLFRNLIIHDGQQLKDHQGNPVSANKFARRYNSPLTPTLLFLDPLTGEELAEKMIGITTIDMYGHYVDKAVRQASMNLMSTR